MPDKELAKVMAWLSEKMRCPLCGFRYNLQGLKVLPHGSNSSVNVHTNCGECACSLMFALDIKGGEVFLVGVVTDLTLEDALKFQTQKPISTDEVLDWAGYWQNFDGDFARALI